MSHASTARKHPFHILPPSPWPLVGSVGAFVAALGGVEVMHGAPVWYLAPGLLVVLATMIGWWRDVVREGRIDHAHTRPVSFGLRLGMALFIASEAMFFVAFFWAYLHNALHFSPVIAGVWPPAGIETLEASGLPLINTVILVASGLVLAWGRGGLDSGNRARLMAGIGGAMVLGFVFLVLQAVEYGHAAFAFRDGIYPSAFYLATGFHGFHVFVGACFLAVCLFRAARSQFSPHAHIGLQAAEWYWHFVDVVWLFLFVVFYVWVGLE